MPRKPDPENSIVFTDAVCSAVRLMPGQADRTIWDSDTPGLGLRLRSSGARVWVLRQAPASGTYGLLTLGPTSHLNLAQVRAMVRIYASAIKATEIVAKKHTFDAKLSQIARKSGEQTIATLAPIRTEKQEPLNTYEHLVRIYLRRKKKELRHDSWINLRSHLTQNFRSLLHMNIAEIKRSDVSKALDIVAETAPFTANRARSVLSTFFKFAIGRGDVEQNPVTGTNKLIREKPRDRVLTDDELKTVWSATSNDDYGRIIRLLILTGQRRDEVAGIAWSELNLSSALWTLPSQRCKNGRAHEVPLSEAALSILGAPEQRPGRDLLFGAGRGPFSGFSKIKKQFDMEIGIKPWRLHDLRRTAATGMANIGILPHIIEAVLNHVSGARAGVAGTYNRALYRAEKRDALDRWAAHVMSLVATNT